jgi:hypothetical protein
MTKRTGIKMACMRDTIKRAEETGWGVQGALREHH